MIDYYRKVDNNIPFISISIGRLKNWWSPDSTREFWKKATCVIDFYSKDWEIQGKNYSIDGERTKGENIADLGGVMQSYSAFGKDLCIYYNFIFLKIKFSTLIVRMRSYLIKKFL